jgi:hypothetical protein
MLIGESANALAQIDDDYFIQILWQRSRYLMRLIADGSSSKDREAARGRRTISHIGHSFSMEGNLMGMVERLQNTGHQDLANLLTDGGMIIPCCKDAMGAAVLHLVHEEVSRLKTCVDTLLKSNSLAALDEFEQNWEGLSVFLGECEQSERCVVKFWV